MNINGINNNTIHTIATINPIIAEIHPELINKATINKTVIIIKINLKNFLTISNLPFINVF